MEDGGAAINQCYPLLLLLMVFLLMIPFHSGSVVCQGSLSEDSCGITSIIVMDYHNSDVGVFRGYVIYMTLLKSRGGPLVIRLPSWLVPRTRARICCRILSFAIRI